MDYDNTSLYPKAMYDENSFYPKIEIGYDFKPHMQDIIVNDLKIENFNQDVTESPILKTKHYDSPNLIFQPLGIEKKLKVLGWNDWEVNIL